jgi:hypothetical protein
LKQKQNEQGNFFNAVAQKLQALTTSPSEPTSRTSNLIDNDADVYQVKDEVETTSCHIQFE